MNYQLGTYQEREAITYDTETTQVISYKKNIHDAEKTQGAGAQMFLTMKLREHQLLNRCDVKGINQTRGSIISRTAASIPVYPIDVNQEKDWGASRSADSTDVNHDRGAAPSRIAAPGTTGFVDPAENTDVTHNKNTITESQAKRIRPERESP